MGSTGQRGGLGGLPAMALGGFLVFFSLFCFHFYLVIFGYAGSSLLCPGFL